MIAFAAPLWLAALGALAVPLAIHLWSHRARRPVRVGSIRLLSGMPPAAARALRPRDPWLLALRLVMLAALALSLAGPHWARRSPRPATWALLSDEALADRALVDSLRAIGAIFRPLEDGTGRSAAPHYWSLLAEADRIAPPGARFVVAAPLVGERFRGARPAVSAPVTWRDVPAGAPHAPPADAPTRRVAIIADAAHRDDARYFEAAIRATAQVTGIPADVTRATPGAAPLPTPAADWLVRLDGDTTSRGAPVWSDGSGTPTLTVERRGEAIEYRLRRRITPDVALSPDFIEAVAALWAGPDAVARPPRISLAQALPAPAAVAFPRPAPAGAGQLGMPLWIVAALAFALDRWLAWRRGRVAP